MFKRSRLIILEEPEYGLGPKIFPPLGNATRYSDTPDVDRNEKALIKLRNSAEKLRKRGKVPLPLEMPFDGPRSAESK